MKKYLFFMIIMIFSASAAFGNITPIGDPVEGNSWSEGFYTDGIGTARIELELEDSTWNTPALSAFTVPGWEELCSNATFAVAEGPAVNRVDMTAHFATDISTPFAIYAEEWDSSGSSLWAGKLVWSGSNWSCQNWDGRGEQLDCSTIIPAPGAILLGSIGVSLVGWLRRRRTL